MWPLRVVETGALTTMSLHFTRQTLEERHRALDDLRRKHLGVVHEPEACRDCYDVYDKQPQCICGRNSWAILTVVVIELGLLLDALHREARNCTGEDNCRHCLQASETGHIHTSANFSQGKSGIGV